MFSIRNILELFLSLRSLPCTALLLWTSSLPWFCNNKTQAFQNYEIHLAEIIIIYFLFVFFSVLCAHYGYQFDFLILLSSMERSGLHHSVLTQHNVHFADSLLFCKEVGSFIFNAIANKFKCNSGMYSRSSRVPQTTNFYLGAAEESYFHPSSSAWHLYSQVTKVHFLIMLTGLMTDNNCQSTYKEDYY